MTNAELLLRLMKLQNETLIELRNFVESWSDQGRDRFISHIDMMRPRLEALKYGLEKRLDREAVKSDSTEANQIEDQVLKGLIGG